MARGVWLVLVGVCACGGDSSGSGDGSSSDATSTGSSTGSDTTTSVSPTAGMTTVLDSSGSSTGGQSSGSDTGFTEPEGPWAPGVVFPSLPDPNPRGLYDLRGLVHTHSPYSHDACDDMPRDENDVIDPVCMADLRRGMCQTRHDFIMLTDHGESFGRSEFPDVLLYDPDRGDTLVERDGMPTANWASCPAVDPVLVMAGTETGMMPVGLESHVPGDVYGEVDVATVQLYRDHGALTLLAHTEDWSVSQIVDLGVDGFEMYNLHANMLTNIGPAAILVQMLQEGGEGLPHPDLVIFPLWQEDERYLETWGTVLSMGERPVTTMGSDAHRNTLPQELPDGERIDSFRRMMLWFSNHVLVDAETWDDRAIKDALRAGRAYGAFEYMGYPEGFDAFAESAAGVVELGGEVSLGDAPEIHAVAPVVHRLDPDVTAPEITLHLLRALDGGFEEVATGGSTLDFMPDEAGAYRVEVRMVPHHLDSHLGDYADQAGTPRVWIYANPFYVVE